MYHLKKRGNHRLAIFRQGCKVQRMAGIVDSNGGEKRNSSMINVVLWEIGVSPKKRGF